MEFQVRSMIQSSNDVEILALLQWLATNYATQITNCTSNGVDKLSHFGLVFATLQEATNCLSALKTTYGERLTFYELAITR